MKEFSEDGDQLFAAQGGLARVRGRCPRRIADEVSGLNANTTAAPAMADANASSSGASNNHRARMASFLPRSRTGAGYFALDAALLRAQA